MPVSVERTDSEFIIRLPLNMDPVDIQNALDYFQCIDIISRSQASEKDIEELSKEVKSGWSEEVKNKLNALDEFKDLLD